MPLWVHSTAVAVADRRRAAAWYCDILGFEVIDDDPEHWTTVGNPAMGAQIHLCEVGVRRRAKGTNGARSTGILLLTKEPMTRIYRRLVRKGVRFSLPPKELPWGSIAKFVDPDGNEYWLMPSPC